MNKLDALVPCALAAACALSLGYTARAFVTDARVARADAAADAGREAARAAVAADRPAPRVAAAPQTRTPSEPDRWIQVIERGTDGEAALAVQALVASGEEARPAVEQFRARWQQVRAQETLADAAFAGMRTDGFDMRPTSRAGWFVHLAGHILGELDKKKAAKPDTPPAK